MKEDKRDAEVYCLTAKCALSNILSQTQDVEQVWQRLRDFVELTALRDGHDKGTPALVFEDGGVCVTMVQEVTP